MTIIRKIGFIGVGNMGHPMAANLLQGGFDVAVFDARPGVTAAFIAQHGGRVAASLAELARDADAIITMLPDDTIVRQVMLEAGGAATVLARGAVLIDMGTCDPTGTRKTAAALAALGIDMIDAPVMGGVVFAKDATLDIMTGGDAALVARCTPVLQAMGRAVTHYGAVGSAHAMKALANYVNACALINAIEALTIGKKFGLDPKMMADGLMTLCAGRNHPISKKIIPQVLTHQYATGMALGFIAKDVNIAVNTAHAIGAAVPLGEKVAQLWNDAAEKIGAGVDQTEIVRYWEQASGVSLTDK